LSGGGLTEQRVREGVCAALGRKAADLLVLNVQGLTSMADYFVICTASSDRHARAVADAIEAAMDARHARPLSIEGRVTGSWILLDYADIVFHVFQDEPRRFYALERLWGDAENATEKFEAAGADSGAALRKKSSPV
jgi:ribosome-associated protein